MRIRRWTRDRNMLMVVVIILGLCSPLRHVAAETELEVLEEVSDALSHADLSLEALRDLLDAVITTITESSSSTTTTAAITTPKTTFATESSSSATTTAAITTPKTTTATSPTTTTPTASTASTTTAAITTPKTTTATSPTTTTPTASTASSTTAAITTPKTTTVTSPTTTTPTASTASTIFTLSPTTTAPSTTITSVTPPTTTSVTTPTTTTIVNTSPTATTSAPTSLTTSLSTAISTEDDVSTEDDDRSLVNLSEDFPSVLRLSKIWNSERLLHTVQGTRRQSSGDVFPFPLPIALVEQSADSEHYKKQKSLSRVDLLIMGVLTKRLHELMSETDNLAWGTRVNDCLRAMKNETAEIYGGSVDKTHAQQLEEKATQLDELVQEGSNDTSLVVEGELVDFDLIDSVQENINNASLMVDDMISDKKADNTEMLVTIVMLSLLFVVVLIGLIVAFVRPWARKSSLKSSRSKWTAGSAVAEDVRTFPDARFMQHSHVYTDPYRSSDTKV